MMVNCMYVCVCPYHTESKMVEHERRELFAVDPLRHSRRLCGGILSDLKKLVRRYPSDIRDMLHLQV